MRGDLAVEVRTDDPEQRFAAGSVLITDPAERGPLTVESTRWHSGRLLVRFAGVADRGQAAALSGTVLLVDSDALPPIEDPDEFYDHQLVGLRAELPDGTVLGTVSDLVHTPGSDLVAIEREGGGEVLVPFLRAMVPTVDLPAGRLVVDPPDGLLDL